MDTRLVLEGSGEAVAKVDIATAFAFLANPHNGPYWFASAAPLEPPGRKLAQGLTWRLPKTKQTRRMLRVRMEEYQPSERFVWATEAGRWATNHTWELRFQPGPQAGTTKVTMTLQLRLGLLGAVGALVVPHRMRHALEARATSALERARTVLEAQQQISNDNRRRQVRRAGSAGHKRRR